MYKKMAKVQHSSNNVMDDAALENTGVKRNRLQQGFPTFF
jgi:hypothetical protein